MGQEGRAVISWPGRWDGWRERSRGEATRAPSAGKVHVEKHDYGDYGAKSNFSARKICSMWNTASGFASKQEHQTTREERLTSFPWWRGGALERWFLTTRCPSRGGSAGMRIKFKSSNYFLNFSPASNVSNCQRCFWGVSLVLPFPPPPLFFFILFFLSLFTGFNCVISN